jgi:hypothetical protein
MRKIAIAWAILVIGLAVEKPHADEIPNLKDQKVISAGHDLFRSRSISGQAVRALPWGGR